MEERNPAVNPSRKIEWVVWGTIAVTMLLIGAAFVRSRALRSQLAGAMDGSEQIDLRPVAQIPDFSLTNQNGAPVSLAALRGSVWVADIIFTRCGGPCPVMTQRLSDLQALLPADLPIKLLTLTTDPEYDQPAVMKQFGERFKADFSRWSFLTGSKEQIARVAVDGLKLIAVEKNPAERESDRDLFIHSILFVLVDKEGRLRGSIESGDPRMKEKVLAAVKTLAREKSPASWQTSATPFPQPPTNP